MKLFKTNYHHKKRIKHMSYKLNLKEEIIEEALDIMYDYIRLKLESVDIDKDRIMTEEEFNEKFPVIAIPKLGYIRPSYRKYRHIMKHKLKKNGK